MTICQSISVRTRRLPRRGRRGFSLVEILLSVFILGIGMIMVASVFPVGANWTRQATEETVGQVIAQNAESVIMSHYRAGGDLNGYLIPNYANVPTNPNTILKNTVDTPFKLQALPGFAVDAPTATDALGKPLNLQGKTVPVRERAYQFGASNPFPAANPTTCTYFWTVLARLDPSHRITNGTTNGIYPATSYKYDIYILVFRKGDSSHSFNWPSEVLNTRGPGEGLIPEVVRAAYLPGTYDEKANPPVVGAIPPIGVIGIGDDSGTVFRQSYDALTPGGAGIARPALKVAPPASADKVLFAPGPNNGDVTSSSLIYVYQTTMMF